MNTLHQSLAVRGRRWRATSFLRSPSVRKALRVLAWAGGWGAVSASLWAQAVFINSAVTYSGGVHGDPLVAYHIGFEGDGSVTVNAGAQFSSYIGNLGQNAEDVGEVLVTGAGSSWQSTMGITPGLFGQGVLTVAAGGTVGTPTLRAGYSSGGNGSILVTGAGSTLTLSSELAVGWESTASLHIEAGGVVQANSAAVAYSGATGEVSITGAGSALHVGGFFYVGASTDGNATIAVQDGGLLSAEETVLGVGDSATLGGGGTLRGGGRIFGALHAEDAARFDFTIGDEVDAGLIEMYSGGSFTVDPGASVVVDLTTTAGFGPGVYTLFETVSGSALAGFDTSVFEVEGGDPALVYLVLLDASEGNINLIVGTPIPEPTTMAALAGGAALAVAWGLRRRRARC